jgi:sulfite dehydrogenase (quinone) subunit SoeC
VHPAPSIILFSTASGAGYGLLFLLGLAGPLGLIPAERWLGFAALALALGAVTFGLLASTFHLGHPERAWRAVSQWRSSWLSREGVMALITYVPALIFAAGWVLLERNGGWLAPFGLLAALGAAVTVWCTAMIYASLGTVPEWREPLVPPLYLAFALMTGALLCHAVLALFQAPRGWAGALAVLATIVAFGLKTTYWRWLGRDGSPSSPESATGLGAHGRVRMLDPPHTQTNYLLSEMGYQIARKHALKLRQLAYVLAAGAALLAIASLLAPGVTGLLAVLGAVSGLGAVAVERWLFFAEATHTVVLYYGRRSA